MKLIKIKGQKQYEELHHLPFNRNYTLRRPLVESIRTFGFIDPIKLCVTDAIDGIKKMWILDGQHRALAANYLGVEFEGVVTDKQPNSKMEVIQIVAAYNNLSKAWELKDYAEAYLSVGKKDYTILLKTSLENGFGIAIIAGLLLGHNRHTQRSSAAVRNGSFKAITIAQTNISLDMVKELKYPMNDRMLSGFHRLRTSSASLNFNKFEEIYNNHYTDLKATKSDEYYEIFKSWMV